MAANYGELLHFFACRTLASFTSEGIGTLVRTYSWALSLHETNILPSQGSLVPYISSLGQCISTDT